MSFLIESRQAVRALRGSPGFAAIAIFTLALGVGANTAIFSVLNAVLLRPLPYSDPGAIVALRTRWGDSGHSIPLLSGGDVVDLRARCRSFEAFSAYNGGEFGVQVNGKASFTGAQVVNAGFFQVFGVRPVRGRTFQDNEELRSAVVSMSFARRNFGDAASAVGKTLSIENYVLEITGVLPDGLEFPRDTEVWVAAPARPDSLDRTAYNYHAVARLKPGVPVEAADAELRAIGASLATAFPASNRGKTFTVVPLRDEIVGSLRPTLRLLMAAVSLVLLIACANVANLLLARGASRSRELAIRAALGASRGRVLRLLLIESTVLAVSAGLIAVLLAYWGVDVLVRLAPEGLPRVAEANVDGRVLLFSMGISLLASLLFGLAPAWRGSRVELNDALKQGGSRGLLGGGSGGFRHVLVVAEIALAVVLAAGGGLLTRSLVALGNVPSGFRPDGLLVMYAHAPARGLDEYRRVTREYERLFSEIGRIPGVRSVAGAMGLPAGQYGSNGSYAVEGRHRFLPGEDMPQAGFRLASPGYFASMGIPILRGRDFTAADQYDAPFTAIVSEALARQSFPNADPIGHRIRCGLDSPEKWMTIVGVVGDVRQSPAEPPGPEIYMAFQQHPYRANELQVVLRTVNDPAALAGVVRRKVLEVSPGTATKFTTMPAMLSASIAVPRFRTFLIGTFAALALLLAMAGVYGVMAYMVARRTSELGLRVALGAGTADVLGAVLGRTMLLTVFGISIGVAASLAAGRALESMLFGVRPGDPATYATVLVAVAVAALGAATAPALRAARIDPLAALREE